MGPKKDTVCDFWVLSNGLMDKTKDKNLCGEKLVPVFTSCFPLVSASCSFFFHAPDVPCSVFAASLVNSHINLYIYTVSGDVCLYKFVFSRSPGLTLL